MDHIRTSWRCLDPLRVTKFFVLDDEEAQTSKLQNKDCLKQSTESNDDMSESFRASEVSSNRLLPIIAWLEVLDKKFSEYVHNLNSIAIEIVLFPFAHVFNRFYSILTMLLSWIVGAYRYD